jgi:hypothetical protein
MKTFKEFLGLIDSASVQEKKELAVKLRDARLTGDPRPEADPVERRARNAEYVRLQRIAYATRDKKQTELAEAEAEFRRVSEKLQSLHGYHHEDMHVFSCYATELQEWAWSGRPHLVDLLLKQLEEEACFHPTETAQYTPGKYSDTHPQGFSNEVSVNARRAALRLLAHRIRTATERCEYATDQELQAFFDAEYKKLPKVESIAAVLAKSDDPRAAKARKLGTHMPAAPAK